MKILVIGSGGREHALCQAFKKSVKAAEVFCADGNAGIAEVAECVPIKPDDLDALANYVSENQIDLTLSLIHISEPTD